MRFYLKCKLNCGLLLLLLSLAACAGLRKHTDQERLRQELLKWESFDSQGVVELSVMGLAQRKMFSAAKNHGELRIDILDGGVMGAGAQPLLSFYSGDYVAFKSPYLPMLEAFDLSSLVPVSGLNLFASADSLLARYGADIIRDKRLEIDSLRVLFNKNYQLLQVLDPRSNTRLSATYTTNGKLSELNLQGPENLTLKLIFDSISYQAPEITPLPEPKAANLLQGMLPLDQIDFKQLLKDFLNGK